MVIAEIIMIPRIILPPAINHLPDKSHRRIILLPVTFPLRLNHNLLQADSTRRQEDVKPCPFPGHDPHLLRVVSQIGNRQDTGLFPRGNSQGEAAIRVGSCPDGCSLDQQGGIRKPFSCYGIRHRARDLNLLAGKPQ